MKLPKYEVFPRNVEGTKLSPQQDYKSFIKYVEQVLENPRKYHFIMKQVKGMVKKPKYDKPTLKHAIPKFVWSEVNLVRAPFESDCCDSVVSIPPDRYSIITWIYLLSREDVMVMPTIRDLAVKGGDKVGIDQLI